jgi:hypothetical protein
MNGQTPMANDRRFTATIGSIVNNLFNAVNSSAWIFLCEMQIKAPSL